jgi:hypothetical protein
MMTSVFLDSEAVSAAGLNGTGKQWTVRSISLDYLTINIICISPIARTYRIQLTLHGILVAQVEV